MYIVGQIQRSLRTAGAETGEIHIFKTEAARAILEVARQWVNVIEE